MAWRSSKPEKFSLYAVVMGSHYSSQADFLHKLSQMMLFHGPNFFCKLCLAKAVQQMDHTFLMNGLLLFSGLWRHDLGHSSRRGQQLEWKTTVSYLLGLLAQLDQTKMAQRRWKEEIVTTVEQPIITLKMKQAVKPKIDSLTASTKPVNIRCVMEWAGPCQCNPRRTQNRGRRAKWSLICDCLAIYIIISAGNGLRSRS